MIPDGWKVEPFGNFISSAQNGFGRRPNGEENGYIVLRIADVTNGFVDISDVRRINMIGKEFDTYQIHKNDLLFVRVNGSRDCVAQCVLVDKEYSDVAFNDHLIRVKLKEGLNSNFVRYVFRSEHIRSKLLSYIPMAQGGQLTVNQASLSCVQIPIPPLLEQCRIAEVLGVWDESIDLLERLIGRVRSRKQGLMQQLLTGKKRFKEFEGSEWKLQTLSDFGKNGCPTVKAGPFGSSLKKEFYTNRGYKIYGQEQVIADSPFVGNYYIDENRFQSLKSCEVLPDDILVTLVGTIGRVLLLPKDIEAGIINPRLLRVRLDKQKILPLFAKHYLESEDNIKLMESLSQGGTMGVLNAKLFKSLPFPCLSIPEQEKIATVLSAADEEISTLEKQLAAYKQQKLGLMQQLLTGKIRVGTI